MKTKECPSCAMEVDKEAKVCPICQYEFPTQAKGVTWVAVLLLVAILLWLIL
jgi:RNA polymerase subunit RPABC4/transcription elongation factor Spt4